MSDAYDIAVPHDATAEAALLGSLIVCDDDAEVWMTVEAEVSPAAFFIERNAKLFSLLRSMRKAGKKIDSVSLRAELIRARQYEDIGGAAALADILQSVPSWLNWRTYSRIVRDLYQRRQIIVLAEGLRASALLPSREQDAVELATRGQQRLAEILETGTTASYRKIGDMTQDAYDQIGTGEVSYVPTGFKAIDKVLGGFGHGEFWVIGARPSMGKSTFVRQMAVRIARMGIPIGFISLEEPLAKMARNLLSAESGIDNHKIRHGNLCQEEYREVASAVGRLDGLPLFFSSTARRVSEIRSMAAILQAREKIQVLIVDYLQRIGGTRNTSDRYEAVTEISLEMSDLAKVSGLAMVCPAQLNRSVQGRDDKRPNMTDLRDSGQIEQDTDGIIFLHREDYYRESVKDGIAEFIIAKNRDGVRGSTVKLRSDLRHQRFMDDDQQPVPFDGEAA